MDGGGAAFVKPHDQLAGKLQGRQELLQILEHLALLQPFVDRLQRGFLRLPIGDLDLRHAQVLCDQRPRGQRLHDGAGQCRCGQRQSHRQVFPCGLIVAAGMGSHAWHDNGRGPCIQQFRPTTVWARPGAAVVVRHSYGFIAMALLR
jgi:hypothetical protein